MRVIILFAGLLVLLQFSTAQAMFFFMTGRNPAVRDWRSLEVEHFIVHYPVGLDSTALACAQVAEQIYGPVTQQLGVEPRKITHISITDEDQVVNGFAIPRQMTIWVNQNDYIEYFSQNRSWLRQVIAHEFQHIVSFEALHDWRGTMGRLLSGTPAWWLEGMAEYYTENWNVLRADANLRRETLDRRLAQSNSHDGGYSRILYLAWRDGDSTIVKINNWRSKTLKVHRFEKAFEVVTGQSLGAFEEEWTRVLNTVYNAELAAGETTDELGTGLKLPIRQIRWLELAPDSSAWYVVGRRGSKERENALYRVTADSTQQVKVLAEGRLKGRAALLDNGIVFDRMGNDSQGRWQSDLWQLDLSNGKISSLTKGQKADDPCSDGHLALAWISNKNSRSRLMYRPDPNAEPMVLWEPGADWELLHPQFSPDGSQIAVGVDDENSLKDVCLVNVDNGRIQRLSLDNRDERDPVWITDSLLVVTVFDNYRANLHRFVLGAGGLRDESVSNSGEGLRTIGMSGLTQPFVQAALLDSANTSRIVLVDPYRQAGGSVAQMASKYTAWREQMPEIQVPDEPPEEVTPTSWGPYRSWKLHAGPWAILPMPMGVVGLASFYDPLAQNTISLLAGGGNRKHMDSGGGFFWVNTGHRWTTTFAALVNWDPEFALEQGELVSRIGSSVAVGLALPLNNRSRPRLKRQLSLDLRLSEHENIDPPLQGNLLNAPDNNQSGELAFSFRKHEAPAEKDSYLWPSWSRGLQLKAGILRDWIFGDESLNYLQFESYGIQSIFHSPVKLLWRTQVDILHDAEDSWRAQGLGRDPLFNPVPQHLISAGLPFGRHTHLRALDRTVLGDQVLLASLEPRLTLGQPQLFRVLGLQNGRLGLAAFLDWADVSRRDRLQPGVDSESLWTTGLELQLELQMAGTHLLSLAGGFGGEAGDWLSDKDQGRYYWKFHLEKPF